LTPAVFAHPFTYWVGMDTDPRTTPEALAEFNRFYSTVHVHEVIAAHAGFVGVSRYELLDPEPRAGLQPGPRWLAVYGMADEAAALQYLKDNARPWLHRRQYSAWPAARRRAKTVWRMLWRQTSVSGSTDQPSESVLLVGTNAPLEPDTPAGGYVRATWWELYRAFAHPDPGCPRFSAAYEGELTPTQARASPALVWGLRYRRIPLPE
jgi:hypothetical protein